MNTRWCFQCGSAYVSGIDECVECGVGLVDHEPTDIDDLSAREPVQLAYELHEWSFEARRMVDQLLTAQSIVHAWQGASVLVLEADEAAVDAVVDQVEQSAMPTLDPDAERTVYEMEGWDPDQVARLADRLGLSGVPHQIDAAGDLVVQATDEEQVDRLVDEVSAMLAAGTPDEVVELEGLGTNELLSRVFVSVDKLRRNPRDSGAIVDLVADAEVVARLRTPFGLDQADWVVVAGRITTLAGFFGAALEDLDDDEVVALSAAVRADLAKLV